MAATGSRAADGAAQAADGAAQAADGAARAADAARDAANETVVVVQRSAIQRPIVYEVRKRGKKGKKEKYSRGMKDPQKAERGVSRAAERLARAVTDGLSEYRKERNKSARRKRDGALRDVVRNVSCGLRDGLTTAAKAPTDLSRHVTTKRLTRLVMPPMPRLPFTNWGWGR